MIHLRLVIHLRSQPVLAILAAPISLVANECRMAIDAMAEVIAVYAVVFLDGKIGVESG